MLDCLEHSLLRFEHLAMSRKAGECERARATRETEHVTDRARVEVGEHVVDLGHDVFELLFGDERMHTCFVVVLRVL